MTWGENKLEKIKAGAVTALTTKVLESRKLGYCRVQSHFYSAKEWNLGRDDRTKKSIFSVFGLAKNSENGFKSTQREEELLVMKIFWNVFGVADKSGCNITRGQTDFVFQWMKSSPGCRQNRKKVAFTFCRCGWKQTP